MSQPSERCSDCPDLDGSGTLCCRVFDAELPPKVAYNKRLDRLVEYNEDGTRNLFERMNLVAANVGVDEAHRFLHGKEIKDDTIGTTGPTFDEMLEAVAARLKTDCEQIMLNCASNEGYLWDMYQRSKEKGPIVRPPWR